MVEWCRLKDSHSPGARASVFSAYLQSRVTVCAAAQILWLRPKNLFGLYYHLYLTKRQEIIHRT